MKKNSIKSFFLTGEFLFNTKLAIILWFGLSMVTSIQNILRYKINNYVIYKYSYIHLTQHKNLYLTYPSEYGDVFLYGPTFSALMAPFSFFSDNVGLTLWTLFNVCFLYLAIRKLPLKFEYQNAILILSSHEMMNASSWLQSNAIIIGCLLFAFNLIQKQKDFWALFFIVFATITKIYGIVGFGFFFLSKQKLKFIFSSFFWFFILFTIPILYTSYSFLLQSYQDWYTALTFKANKNIRMDIQNDFQDISVMGMIRRGFNLPNFKDIYIVPIAALVQFSLFLRYKFSNDIRYAFYLLCTILLFVVIFSNGSESPTYIIAFPACCIWFVLQPPSRQVNAVFVFCLLLTSFSYSDIFTPYVREHLIRPYSLKALPCLILWLVIVYQIITKQFLKVDVDNGLKLRFVNSSLNNNNVSS